jgi:predicted RNA binding protein YcfA (HicA-like mRNA interferase family)
MGKRDKILERMKNNPKDNWSIDVLKSLADYYGIEYASHGTSHVVFRHYNGSHVTVPAHRPIKPVYIRAFLELIETEAKK